MNEPLVTIAIPLYNHASFIEACLDGVLAQELPNAELLLIDDGSRDEGFRLAKDWEAIHGGRFVRTWMERQPNAGITPTMDRLIRQSRGDFVIAVASDDILLPGSVLKRLPFFKDPEVLAVFGDAIPIDESGHCLGESAIAGLGHPAMRTALADSRTILWELIFRWNVYGSVLMCRRAALTQDDGTSVLKTDIYSEDMQLYYRFGALGGLRYLDEPVALYRIHPANTHRTPENLDLLRRNIHESRKASSLHMSTAYWLVVRIQAFTYFRWRPGWSGILLKPMVAFAYGGLFGARLVYDAYRWLVLRQKDHPLNTSVGHF